MKREQFQMASDIQNEIEILERSKDDFMDRKKFHKIRVEIKSDFWMDQKTSELFKEAKESLEEVFYVFWAKEILKKMEERKASLIKQFEKL